MAAKKPTAIRELHGTANRNKQRNVENPVEPDMGIGPAPSYFCEQQREVWDYLVSVMFVGVLGNSDRPTFEVLATLFHRFRYGAHGDDSAPYQALSGVELNCMNSIMARYGMTPSDRTKISARTTSKNNPFSAF